MQHLRILACTMACTMLEVLFGTFLLLFLRLSWWWKLLCYLARFDHAKIMWLGWLGLQHAAFRNFSLHNGLHNVGDSLWSFVGPHFKALMVGGCFNGMLQDLCMIRSCGLYGLACNMQHLRILACTIACKMLEILFEAFLVPFLRLSWWCKLLWHHTRFIHAKITWIVWLSLQHMATCSNVGSWACTMACRAFLLLFSEALMVVEDFVASCKISSC